LFVPDRPHSAGSIRSRPNQSGFSSNNNNNSNGITGNSNRLNLNRVSTSQSAEKKRQRYDNKMNSIDTDDFDNWVDLEEDDEIGDMTGGVNDTEFDNEDDGEDEEEGDDDVGAFYKFGSNRNKFGVQHPIEKLQPIQQTQSKLNENTTKR
jgi:hypothetical protein